MLMTSSSNAFNKERVGLSTIGVPYLNNDNNLHAIKTTNPLLFKK